MISLEPPPGVAAPAHTLPRALPSLPNVPSYSSFDNDQLEGALARSQTENQLMQEELSAIREQLASTTAQLAASRVVARPETVRSGDRFYPHCTSDGRSYCSHAISDGSARLLIIIQVRLDGSVVRVEVSSDRLFESGTANLLPVGASLLTQLAADLERVFPRHFLGIEGHLDTESLEGIILAVSTSINNGPVLYSF